MRVEFVEPFVCAAFSVLETLLKSRPRRGVLAIRATTSTTHQLTIVIGVNGDITGTVLYGMSLVTAQNIASAMAGEPMKGMDEMAWSMISELGNIITGKAAGRLQEAGYQCETTPPSVLRGVNMWVPTTVPALVVPLSTKFGRFEINAALVETAATTAEAA